ncbi:MAG TPA: TonB-dependent receptor [Bryobacteraceae bacterium]|nr:TonB-dependent receptor [Bryobacteraceae bacterium]
MLAQTDRGTITGTVSDPAGAVVSSAPLVLANTGTGAQYQAATSGTGNYTFGQLPIGNYTLTVAVPGFKSFIRRNLNVQAASTIREDIILEVGTATESVTVTAETSMMKTETAEVATNVTSARLNSLPILGVGAQTASSHGVRNPLAAAQLQTGVRFVANSIVRVNGAPNNTMAVKLDGQDITNNTAGAAFQAQVQPSVDAVEEVAIQTSNYAAEYGQAGGGLFNYSTKSGGNTYHGGLFDYAVNEALWAAQPFNKIRPLQRRHTFGGSFGGAVRIPGVYNGKDKTFFNFNYEKFRESVKVNNVTTTVPVAAYRAGNFAGLLSGRYVPTTGSPTTSPTAATTMIDANGNAIPEGGIYDPRTEALVNGNRVRTMFPGNTIPATRFDTPAVKVQDLIPRPNYSTGLVSNYLNPYQSTRLTPIPSLKLDHSLSDRLKASFYWSTNETSVAMCAQQCASIGLPAVIEPTRGTFIESYTLRANVDYTFRPTILLHFGAGLLSNDFKDDGVTIGYDPAKELGITGGLGGAIGRFPTFTGLVGAATGASSAYQGYGGMGQMGPGGQTRSRFLKPTGNISMSWVKANHTYKFGSEIRIEGYPTAPTTSSNGAFAFLPNQTSNSYLNGRALGGTFVGFPYASFLLGRVDTVTLGPTANGRSGRGFYSWFAQDTWKVTRKLTLDYGLRWDAFTTPKEQYGRAPSLDPNLPNANAGGHPGATVFEATCNCSFGKTYKLAYGPRTGLAYQIDSKTVLRAGIGVSYSMSPGSLGQTGTGNGRTQQATNTSYGDEAMVLSNGIPLKPVWPDLRANLFPSSPGTINQDPGQVDQNLGRPARMIQYSINLQRQISRDFVVEVGYVGNRGNWWMTGSLTNPNLLDPTVLKDQYGLDWFGSAADRAILSSQLNSAGAGRFRGRLPYSGFPTTSTVAQSLRPFPQFTDITVTGAPLGKTWYDSFQMKATKRLSHGLDFTMNYTYSKELQLGAESDTGGGVINDILNRNSNKQLSSNSRPHWLVIATNYTVQKYFGNKALNFALADWQLGFVLQYGSGLPIQTPANTGNNNNVTLGRATYATRVPGQPLFLVDNINCGCYDYGHTQILNPAAWIDTPSGQFSPSAAFYNDFRYQRRPSELASIARNFRIKEGITFMIRAEFNNVMNRTLVATTNTAGFVEPSLNRGTGLVRDAATGTFTSGFGTINTLGNIGGQRQGTLVGRLTF